MILWGGQVPTGCELAGAARKDLAEEGGLRFMEKERQAMRGMANIFKLFRNVLKGPFIADTPADLSQCEFGCRVLLCNHGKWQSCENRIRIMNEEVAFLQTRPDHDSAANEV